MITYPRDNPFFSLHGPKYADVCKFFDPRLTQTEDILGKTIFQDQAFIDPGEEIPVSNDLVFESCIPLFHLSGNIDLPPLNIGGLLNICEIQICDLILTKSYNF